MAFRLSFSVVYLFFYICRMFLDKYNMIEKIRLFTVLPLIIFLTGQQTGIQAQVMGSYTDPRDGQTYKTVRIGDQVWMAENLNVGKQIKGRKRQKANDVIEKYCYDDKETNCDKYGGLYMWDEAMRYLKVEGTQGICPPGWHLPSDEELCSMTHYLDPAVGCSGPSKKTVEATSGVDIGIIMKSTSGWESGNGNNASGFNILPGGLSSRDGKYSRGGRKAYLWTSSESTGSNAWYRYFNLTKYIYRSNFFKNRLGYSVRCVKD